MFDQRAGDVVKPDEPLYYQLPPDWMAITNALAWTGQAIVQPTDHQAKARLVLDFLIHQGWLLVRADDIEPTPPRRAWRWKR